MDLREKCENSSTSWEERIGQQMREREREHEINSFPVVTAGTPTSSSASSGNQLLQYERNLNFATVAMDDGEYGFPKKKTIRDPLSHRIIEKRRRDRMNNCLADLARLLPQTSLRKGRGRIEKTEIVELAIKHLKHLQTHPCPHGDSCELNPMKPTGTARKPSSGPRLGLPIIPQPTSISIPCVSSGSQINPQVSSSIPPTSSEPFKHGFQECLNEAIHFLLESKSMIMMANNDTENCTKLCRNLVQHLNQHVERILRENASKNRKLSNGFPSQGSDSTNEFNQKLCSGNSITFGCRPTRASSPGSDYNNGANDGESRHPISGDNSSCHSHYFNDHERNALDCDVDNNSCSSTPLSIEVSDVMSSDGRNTCNGHSGNLLSVPQMSWEKRSPTIRSPGCQTARASNCRSSDEGHEILSPTSHRYKFKNNIKQRFTADTRTKREPDTESNSSFSKLDHQSQPCDDQARDFAENDPEIARENRDHLVSSPGSEGMPEMSTCRNAFIPRVSVVDLSSLAECEEPEITVNPPRSTARCVPAFVLHDNGNFYIPLTLDRSVISDEAFLEDFDEIHYNALPLHPVTISVCYSTTLNKDNNKQQSPLLPRNLVTEKKRNNTNNKNLAVSPMILTRDPTNNVVEIINEIPKPDPNFIMNRFEQSQIEANRHHLSSSSNNSYRHCPDSAVGVNYRNFNINQHIFSGFPKCDSARQSITSIDNKSSDTNDSRESMLLRKDPAKSAFVGYKPWRSQADRSPIPVPADLSSKRNSSTVFGTDQLDVPNTKSRRLTPTDFHPRILCNGPGPISLSVVQHKIPIPKDS